MKVFAKRVIGLVLIFSMLVSSLVFADTADSVTDPAVDAIEETDGYDANEEETSEQAEGDETTKSAEDSDAGSAAADNLDADYTGMEINDGTYKGVVNDDGETVTITGLTDWARPLNISIPRSIQGKTVTAISKIRIDDSYFRGTLTIPNTVTTIGDTAFWDCSGFTGNLIIPDSVTQIGFAAFAGCSGFKGDLIIPDSVTTIENRAFSGCSGFTGELRISNSITDIGQYTFFDCSGFTGELIIPNGVKTIGGCAFQYCSGFTGLTLPKSVTLLDGHAFYECSGFKGDLIIPDSVTTIGIAAFCNCDGFTGDLIIPDSVTKILGSAFYYCSGLAGNLIIPKSVTYIGTGAFCGCTGFTELTITGSETRTEVGEHGSFVECDGLTRVTNKSDYSVGLPGNKTWKNEATGEVITQITNGTAIAQLKNLNFWSYWKTNEECQYSFDENWFFKPSSEYNHNLLRMSIKTAMAAFPNPEDATDGGNIKNLFNGLGMKPVSVDYDKPGDKDGDGSYNTIGSAIGSRSIKSGDKEARLILVALRGAGYVTEWGSNFYVKSKKNPEGVNGYDHAGFALAADQVMKRLEKYVNANHIDVNNAKIWICGYSRGAATSNLLAKRVIDEGIGGSKVESENVFAFCFECPQNTTDPNAGGSKYNGIYSIVNPVDFVPQVAMNNGMGWKYTRYGRTLTIPSFLTDSGYSSYAERAKKRFYNLPIEWKAGQSDRESTISLIGSGEELVFGNIIYYLVKDLANKTMDPLVYKSLYQNDFVESVGVKLLSETGGLNGWDVLKLYLDAVMLFNKGWRIPQWIYSRVDEYTGNRNNYGVKDTLGSVHFPELCLTWMEELNKDELIQDIEVYEGDQRKIYQVPIKRSHRFILVEVMDFLFGGTSLSNGGDHGASGSNTLSIYDSNNNLVGKVVNGTPEDIANGVFIAIDDNGQILIDAPGDGDYRIEVDSAADTMVSCSIEEIDAGTNALDRVVVYPEIPVKSGEKASVNIGRVTENAEADYSAKDGKDQAITPATDAKDGSVEYYTVEISESDNGTAYGAGSYIKNQQVALAAKPNEGYRFKCWLSGDKPVSEDPDYSFRITQNISLTPVFEKDSSVPVTGITITPKSKQLKKGKTVTLKATITPDDATDKSLIWSSSNKKVATVSKSGKVTAKGPGKATITATAKDGSNVSAKATITVPGVTVNTSKLFVQKDKTNKNVKYTLTKDKFKSVKANNKNVTVKAKGKVLQITGKKKGKSTVTITTKGGSKAKLTVTVQDDKVVTKTIKVSPANVKVGKGESVTVKVTASPDKISTGEKIKVTASKKGIVKYKIDQDAGTITVTGKKKGTCKLTVKAGKKSKKITVKVVNQGTVP